MTFLASPAAGARAATLLFALLAGAAHDSGPGSVPRARGDAREAPQDPPRPLEHFNLGKERLAVAGWDPVAYFPEGGGKPRKGLASVAATHRGVTYRFASDAHRALFLRDPARYEPRYGGWCAYAMADGEKVGVDPESFLVADGKLYLFFKSWYADTRAKWRKDEERLRRAADAAWSALVERPKPR